MIKQNSSREPQATSVTASQRLTKHMTEGGFILVLAVAVLILFSLVTHQAQNESVNAVGQVGEFIAIHF